MRGDVAERQDVETELMRKRSNRMATGLYGDHNSQDILDILFDRIPFVFFCFLSPRQTRVCGFRLKNTHFFRRFSHVVITKRSESRAIAIPARFSLFFFPLFQIVRLRQWRPPVHDFPFKFTSNTTGGRNFNPKSPHTLLVTRYGSRDPVTGLEMYNKFYAPIFFFFSFKFDNWGDGEIIILSTYRSQRVYNLILVW